MLGRKALCLFWKIRGVRIVKTAEVSKKSRAVVQHMILLNGIQLWAKHAKPFRI